jgi:hypothetical protein
MHILSDLFPGFSCFREEEAIQEKTFDPEIPKEFFAGTAVKIYIS